MIYWYMHFIYVKLQRALHGKVEDDGREIENGFQRDFDGSAKVALIAIDRSMEAWIKLMQHLPDIEDEIISLLALLQRIKLTTENEFPEAGKFIRPGFDTAPVP